MAEPPAMNASPQAPSDAAVRRALPWIVAFALFMERLDATIVHTSLPAMAASLDADPLMLKAVSTVYILALAATIPASGWLADRFGTRRVFMAALVVFTLASAACAAAMTAGQLIAARIPQGMAAALMMPVGRVAILRTFPKGELLRAMNFVIMPALIGPMLGPALGGLIVDALGWRWIFLVNLPVGLVGWLVAARLMPDYRGAEPRRLDTLGLLLFGAGVAVLTWALERFSHAGGGAWVDALALAGSGALLGLYLLHARHTPQPLLSFELLRLRTFRASVVGGFITRLGLTGMPLLLPLLYQVGLGLPAWQSGLLMMPSAFAAIGMKALSVPLLRRFGFRRVLVLNTVLAGAVIASFATVGQATPWLLIATQSLAMGFFNSLQFSAMNTLAYADVPEAQTSAATTLSGTMQQLSMSFGLALGAIVAAAWLGNASQDDAAALREALHLTFLTVGALTVLSSLSFWTLRPDDGAHVSGQR